MDLLPRDYKKTPAGGRIKIAPTKGFVIPGIKKQASPLAGIFSSKKIMVAAFIIFVITLALWGGFTFYRKKIEKDILSVRDEIKALEEARDPEMIKKITSFEKGISILKGIIAEHQYCSKIFGLLEQNTLPQVAWESFGLDVKSQKISLSGRTKSYSFLAKQIVAFEGSPLNPVKVSNIDLSSEGGIEFGMELGFKPEILKEP